jgi:hypothetical protein
MTKITCGGRGLVILSKQVKTLSIKALRRLADGGASSLGRISSRKNFPKICVNVIRVFELFSI